MKRPSWLRWPSWFPVSSHDRLSIILTFVIAALTAGNVGVAIWYASITKKAAKDNGGQTERIIDAANIQARAATENADSAASMAISAGKQADYAHSIADQTLKQATATNRLAIAAATSAKTAKDALERSSELSHEDRRAWVSAEIGEQSGKFFIAMHNTGKTPAVNVTYVSSFSPGKLGRVPNVDFNFNSSTPIDTRNLPPDIIEHLKKDGTIPDHPPHRVCNCSRQE